MPKLEGIFLDESTESPPEQMASADAPKEGLDSSHSKDQACVQQSASGSESGTEVGAKQSSSVEATPASGSASGSAVDAERSSIVGELPTSGDECGTTSSSRVSKLQFGTLAEGKEDIAESASESITLSRPVKKDHRTSQPKHRSSQPVKSAMKRKCQTEIAASGGETPESSITNSKSSAAKSVGFNALANKKKSVVVNEAMFGAEATDDSISVGKTKSGIHFAAQTTEEVSDEVSEYEEEEEEEHHEEPPEHQRARGFTTRLTKMVTSTFGFGGGEGNSGGLQRKKSVVAEVAEQSFKWLAQSRMSIAGIRAATENARGKAEAYMNRLNNEKSRRSQAFGQNASEAVLALSPLRRRTLTMLKDNRFESALGCAVLTNCIAMGVEMEVIKPTPGVDECTIQELRSSVERCRVEATFYYLDFVFLVVFTIELLIRIYAFRLVAIMTLSGLFDFVIVMVGWLTEVVIPLILSSAGTPNLKTLQTLKMLRVLRAVRVLRMATMFKDLYMTIMSFFRCLKPLLWVMLFIFIIMYLFAIMSINIIGRNDELRNIMIGDESVEDRFGFTTVAMVTLFQLMTLDEWYAIVEPLTDASPWLYIFFLTFIAIGSLALMNLVTAVVVEMSVRRGRDEDAKKAQAELFDQKVAVMVDDIQDIFTHFDSDDSGYVDIHEFTENALRVPYLANLCEFLQVQDMDDLEEFFILIAGDDEQLSIEEFVEAVTKINQAATDRNIVALIRTANSRGERFQHVKKIIDKQPEVLENLQCDFEDTGLRIDMMRKELDSVQEEFNSGMRTLQPALLELKQAVNERALTDFEYLNKYKIPEKIAPPPDRVGGGMLRLSNRSAVPEPQGRKGPSGINQDTFGGATSFGPSLSASEKKTTPGGIQMPTFQAIPKQRQMLGYNIKQ